MGTHWDGTKVQLLEHINNYTAQYLFSVAKSIQAGSSLYKVKSGQNIK